MMIPKSATKNAVEKIASEPSLWSFRQEKTSSTTSSATSKTKSRHRSIPVFGTSSIVAVSSDVVRVLSRECAFGDLPSSELAATSSSSETETSGGCTDRFSRKYCLGLAACPPSANATIAALERSPDIGKSTKASSVPRNSFTCGNPRTSSRAQNSAPPLCRSAQFTLPTSMPRRRSTVAASSNAGAIFLQ